MRALALLLVAAACSGGGGGREGFAHRAIPGDVAIVGGTVVTMDRAGTLSGQTVLLRGDRIRAVAPAELVDTRAATIVEARGTWVMPGLADMHVHLWGERDLDLFVLNGVTTVRNLFGSPDHLRWRDAIARGERAGPTLITAGPILDGEPPTWPGSAVVTTPDAARAAVAAQKAAGYDWLKVYNGLGADVYAAILDEAKKVGLPIGGHVPKAVGIAGVIASGQRTIEHVDGYVPFFGPAPDGDLIAPTVAAGVWNCPTLVVTERFGALDHPERLAAVRGLAHVDPAVRAAWDPKNDFRLARFTPEMFESVRAKNLERRRIVGALQAAGGKLVLGTDTGNPYVVPGYAVADELWLLVAAGLTPAQAVHTATAAAAEMVGTPGAFGVVAAGARADLILVGGDPLADVAHVMDPSVVIVRGKVHRRAELVAAVEKKAASAAEKLAVMKNPTPKGVLLFAAEYEVQMNGRAIGAERVVASRDGLEPMLIQGQVVYGAPMPSVTSYQSTRDTLHVSTDALEPGRIAVRRRDTTIVAVQEGKPPLELAADAATVIAPQAVAELVWYTPELTPLAVGASRELRAAAVRTDGALALDPSTLTFTRAPDEGKQRVYTFTGRYGTLDVTGRFVLDPDGAPAEVTAKVKFGTFTTRRLPI